jgi:hypothetical protein
MPFKLRSLRFDRSSALLRLANKPEHPVSIALFDLIAESAALIRANPKEIEARIESEAKILEFCEDFFQQFLMAVAGLAITGFDQKDKEEVARTRMASKSRPARAVMAQYEKLCDTYYEFRGSVQLPGSERRFRVTFVTRLMARIEAWAKSIGDMDLIAKVSEVAEDYADAVKGQ